MGSDLTRALVSLRSTFNVRGFLGKIDRTTRLHLYRVSRYAVQMGELLELSPRDLHSLEIGSLVHDLGKVGVEPLVWHKPGQLTQEERRHMEEHTEVGAQMLREAGFDEDIVAITLGHHLWWNGDGYPASAHALSDHQKFLCQIVALADVFDALSTPREYKPGWSEQETYAYIKDKFGTFFDPKLESMFEEWYDFHAHALNEKIYALGYIAQLHVQSYIRPVLSRVRHGR